MRSNDIRCQDIARSTILPFEAPPAQRLAFHYRQRCLLGGLPRSPSPVDTACCTGCETSPPCVSALRPALYTAQAPPLTSPLSCSDFRCALLDRFVFVTQENNINRIILIFTKGNIAAQSPCYKSRPYIETVSASSHKVLKSNTSILYYFPFKSIGQ